MARSKSCYSREKNWSSSNGTYRNGNGARISNPRSYFRAVGSNRHGFNSCFRNGFGKQIDHPREYFVAVGEDRHGFNR